MTDSHAAAQLVAASPPAAGVPTQRKAPPEGDWPEDFEHENGQYLCQCCHCGNVFTGHKRRVVCKTCAASPVAPVGAPTEEDAKTARDLATSFRMFTKSSHRWHDGRPFHEVAADLLEKFALLSAQGCELATDATKQLGEPSPLPLVLGAFAQDALDFVHPAMSTSSVPTAAPLLSSRETDRSELPREPLDALFDELELVLTDPESSLSAGAVRALKYVRSTLEDFRMRPASSEAAPSAFVLVPREPTHDMLNAFYDAPAIDDGDDSDWRKSYRAMLAAAPKEQQ